MFRHICIIILCVFSMPALFAGLAACNEPGPDASMDPARVFLVFTTGLHRAGTFGDIRGMIKDLAHLVDYEVVEEDR